jgi:hypothetical protein
MRQTATKKTERERKIATGVTTGGTIVIVGIVVAVVIAELAVAAEMDVPVDLIVTVEKVVKVAIAKTAEEPPVE